MSDALEELKVVGQFLSVGIALFALWVARGAKAVARRKPIDDFVVRLVVEEFESVLRDVDAFQALCAPLAPDRRAPFVAALQEEREKAFCRMRLLETVQGIRSHTLSRMRAAWSTKAWDSSLETDSLPLEPQRADELKELHQTLVKTYMAALRQHIEDIKSDR